MKPGDKNHVPFSLSNHGTTTRLLVIHDYLPCLLSIDPILNRSLLVFFILFWSQHDY